jgi:hypothetical protein
MTSSGRYKVDRQSYGSSERSALCTRPATLCYKKEVDPARRWQFGFVAEGVRKINRDVVVCVRNGKPYSVRYQQGGRDVAQ